jgi:hypothetical protein
LTEMRLSRPTEMRLPRPTEMRLPGGKNGTEEADKNHVDKNGHVGLIIDSQQAPPDMSITWLGGIGLQRQRGKRARNMTRMGGIG